ncbi:MAG: hypothetical protein EHM45_23580, partial [Desulfobacteraceae bacterium]
MRIGIAHKRAVQAIAQRFIGTGGRGPTLKILIRCGLIRRGFDRPSLIFRKARGPQALNPTTRVFIDRVFNRYYKNNVFILPATAQRADAVQREHYRPQIEPARSWVNGFPPDFSGRMAPVEQMRYIREFIFLNAGGIGRESARTGGPAGRPGPIKRQTPSRLKPDRAIVEKQSEKTVHSPRVERSRVPGEQREIFSNWESLTVREMLRQVMPAGSGSSGIRNERDRSLGALILTKPEANRPPKTAEIEPTLRADRIFARVAECAVRNSSDRLDRQNTAGFATPIYSHGTEQKTLSGYGRIEHLGSKLSADGGGVSEAVQTPMGVLSRQTGRMQTIRTVLKSPASKPVSFARVLSDQAQGEPKLLSDSVAEDRWDLKIRVVPETGTERSAIHGPEGTREPMGAKGAEHAAGNMKSVSADFITASNPKTRYEKHLKEKTDGSGKRSVDQAPSAGEAEKAVIFEPKMVLARSQTGDRERAPVDSSQSVHHAVKHHRFITRLTQQPPSVLYRKESGNRMSARLAQAGHHPQVVTGLRQVSGEPVSAQASQNPFFKGSVERGFAGRSVAQAGVSYDTKTNSGAPE